MLLRRRCFESVTQCNIVLGVLFKQLNHSSSDQHLLVQWKHSDFSLYMYVSFYQPRLLYLCSVSDIYRVLSFYYICRYWRLRYRQSWPTGRGSIPGPQSTSTSRNPRPWLPSLAWDEPALAPDFARTAAANGQQIQWRSANQETKPSSLTGQRETSSLMESHFG